AGMSFGALYKGPFGINPYISYAESFEPVVGLDNVTGNPLKPSEGEQVEVGIKFQPSGSSTYITAAYFDIEQSNLRNSSALPSEPSQFEGVAKLKGFELEAQTRLGDVTIDGSLTHLDTEDPNGVTFPSIPDTRATIWGLWAPKGSGLDNFRFGSGIRYSAGNESHGTTAGGTDFTVSTDEFILVDALIGYSFNDIDLTLNARNLFDEEYYGTCLARGDCFPGERRSVVARAAYKF
ncbi:MAG: TonB-dependent receptor, partial [Pseudomonadota bacterium]